MGLGLNGLPQPPKLSSGAGRTVDLFWPDDATNPQSSAPMRSRNSVASPSSTYTNGAIATVGTVTYNNIVYRGHDVAEKKSGTNNNLAIHRMRFPPFHLRTTKAPFPQDADAHFVKRIVAVMAFTDMADNALRDQGLEVFSQTSGAGTASGFDIITAVQAGFGIICRATGIVTLIMRNTAGVLTSIDLTAPPFVTADLHAYELRITSPTATAEAKVQAFVDDVQLAQVDWASGKLPVSDARFFSGFQWSLVGPQQPGSMYCHSARFITAPSLDDAL